jgi:sigma-B regulation protein RsbU (phosphoserine phosphatase)
VLGLFEQAQYELGEVQLFPGDTVVAFTDGVSEAVNESGEEFGVNPVIEAVRTSPNLSLDSLARDLMERVRRFSPNQLDDETVLLLRRTG